MYILKEDLMKKRVLSMLMALALCLTLLPTAALADELGSVDGASTVETAGADVEAEAKAKADAEAVATVQAMIGELPDADELPGMSGAARDAAYLVALSVYDAYEDLTAEQQAQVSVEKLTALLGWFSSQVATLADKVTGIWLDGVDLKTGEMTQGTQTWEAVPLENTSEDLTLTGGNIYVVGENQTVTINGDLTMAGNSQNYLILFNGAELIINGALILEQNGLNIYSHTESQNLDTIGQITINNSKEPSGAAIRSSTDDARTLNLYGGKLTAKGGKFGAVSNVYLNRNDRPLKATLGGELLSPADWAVTTAPVNFSENKDLVIEWCTHPDEYDSYVNNGDGLTHHLKCDLCGFEWLKENQAAETESQIGHFLTYTILNDTYHKGTCRECGAEIAQEKHESMKDPDGKPVYSPTPDGKGHVSGACACGYSSGTVEDHKYSDYGTCTDCGFTPVATTVVDENGNATGSLYESIEEAIERGATELWLVSYEKDATTHEYTNTLRKNLEIGEGVTLTLHMNGVKLEGIAGSPALTVSGGTLTVQGEADLVSQNIIASSENPAPAVSVTSGSLVFEDAVTATGGKSSSAAAPAIEVSGGTVTFQGEVNATAQLIDSTTSDPDLSPAIKVTGGTVTFAQKLTATGGRYDDNANRKQQQPAVSASGGTLDFQNGLELNGGLTLTGDAALKNKLTQGTFTAIEGIDVRRVSVDGSNPYKRIADLLEDGYAFADNNKALVAGGSYNIWTISDLTIVPHTHDWKPDSTYTYLHRCACGASDNHSDWKDGKCEVCGYECPHKQVDTSNGTCEACHMQMKVRIENDNTTTYGTDFKAAMKAAENGTTVKLLADIEWGVAPQDRATITGDGKIVTLNLNGHTITGGWLDIGNDKSPTSCTLKIIGEGSHESLGGSGGYSGVFPKATLDLSEWEGGTINAINISDNSNYEAETREAAVIVGPKAGTIGKLTFGNNQLGELKKTKLSGGSFNEIWAADFGSVKLGELLADGYAFQNEDGPYVKYETTLQGESIFNVKVVKCLHPNMKPDETGVATCEYCGKSGKFVASVDGNLYTAGQWKDAFKAWLGDAEDEKANGILKLYTDYKAEAADATWSVGYRPNGNTLDLNGHMMSVQGDGAFKPTNNMHLTVTDGTERGQITNILLDGSQRGSFTLENGYVCNLEMTGGAVVALKGGRVDKLDVQNCSANTNLSIQGGSIGKLNIKDWADGMHVSATGGSLGAYNLSSGKILADVLDHQYYATGTSLDKRVDAVAQKWEKFVIKQAPYDFGSTSKAANVPINGSIPFMVDSPSGNVGVYDVKWYRRTNSGAEHMTLNRVADVKVGDTLDVFCVITGLDRPGGAMQWQVAVKDYTIKVVPARLNGDQTVITQKPGTGNTRNPADNRLVVTPFSSSTLSDVEYKFAVTYNGQPLELNKDYTIKDSSNLAMNAGTHTLTIEGMGNYTGEKSVTWTLEPYELSVENYCHAQINKTYDGTDAVTDSTNGIDALASFMLDSKNPRNPILLTLDNLDLDKSDYELSNMKFDSAEAGDRTFTGTMTLTPGGNFVFAKGSRVMQIEYSSDRMPVYISSAIIAAPAAKALQVANNHAATYTVDLSALLPALEAPREYGAVTYGAPTVNLSSDYYTSGAKVEDGKLILPIQAVKTSKESNIGTVTVKVTSGNIVDFDLTINVIAKNRITPTGTPTLSKNAITYGDALNTIALSGKLHDNVNNVDVDGTFEWVDGTHIPVVGNGTYAAEWIFEPTDTEKYLTVSGRSNITVEKAQPYGKVSMAGYTYGQMPSMPSLTEQTGDGSVTYYYSTTNSNSGGTKWENIQADTLNAGTYYMYAELGETENYDSFTTACEKFRVLRAMPTYTAPTGLAAKYGQTLADVTLPGGWSWMDSSESVGGASTAAKKFMAKFTPTDTDNYNTVENIELEVTVNKADGRNLKTVELERKYTDTSEHTYTPDWAGLPAGQDWTFSSEATIVLPKQDFAADGSLLTYAISGGKAGDKITITLKASCDNNEDFTITLNVTLTEKDDQKSLTITGGTTVVYGQTLQLGTSGGNGNGAVTYAVTNGTGEATIDATGKLTPVKVGKVKVSATKAGDASYNSIISAEVEITITRATPTGEPAYTKITASGKTLADAALGIGTITPAGGTIAWDDPTTTEVVANKSYGWTYTPTDTNYTIRTGTIKLWSKSSGGGSGRTAAVVAPDMPMLYRGCTGDAVKTLQEKLNAKGFDSGNVDGIFGAKTYAAVTAFQKANSLGVDGIVGKLTWAKLYDATPVNVTPVTTQPMLRTGSRGDAVRKLQELLNAKGYTCGNVDGIFGSKTYAAVLAFQKANGLAADGIVGPLTWGKLV